MSLHLLLGRCAPAARVACTRVLARVLALKFSLLARACWALPSHVPCARPHLPAPAPAPPSPDYQPNEEQPISASSLPIKDGSQAFSLKSMQVLAGACCGWPGWLGTHTWLLHLVARRRRARACSNRRHPVAAASFPLPHPPQMEDYQAPRMLAAEELPAIVDQYR